MTRVKKCFVLLCVLYSSFAAAQDLDDSEKKQVELILNASNKYFSLPNLCKKAMPEFTKGVAYRNLSSDIATIQRASINHGEKMADMLLTVYEKQPLRAGSSMSKSACQNLELETRQDFKRRYRDMIVASSAKNRDVEAKPN